MSRLTDSTSKPSYGALAWQNARHHLFVADPFGVARVACFIAEPPPAGTSSVRAALLLDGSVNTLAHDWPDDTLFIESRERLDDTLSALLKEHSIGSRLYLCGTEAFVTDVLRIALARHFVREAIATELSGPTLRNVQCAHCKSIYRNVTRRAIHCSRCDVPLVVRDHFSSRLGAYQAIFLRGSPAEVHAMMEEAL